jgi:adenine C2-methylase RlmN of 23S rRNA A2503 and tRNA A37
MAITHIVCIFCNLGARFIEELENAEITNQIKQENPKIPQHSYIRKFLLLIKTFIYFITNLYVQSVVRHGFKG